MAPPLIHKAGCPKTEGHQRAGAEDCASGQRTVFIECRDCGARTEWKVDCG